MKETQPTIVLDGMCGKTIGNYIVRHKLGEGGMGAVYFAEHPSIGKRVALKVLHADFASQSEIVSRFFNEAKAVNDIQHPNIVDVVDFGIITPATPADPPLVYFIMEYLEGVSLSEVIRRDAPLTSERAVDIALQICDALSASHRKGVVHRDLKPDNVMLLSRGRQHDFVKLLDFGIAKLTANAVGTHRTRTGMVMGTPHYMSPEQCDGRGNIDHRADVYALGIVMYQMLTGRVPFGGDGFGEVLLQQMTKAPLAPSLIAPQIPQHLELVVLKALEKRVEDRYQRLDDMMLALQDPVHYVATRGGRAGFLMSPVQRDPAPGESSAAIVASRSGVDHPVSTTLRGSASQFVAPSPAKPGLRIPVGFGLTLALVIGGVVAAVVLPGSPPATPTLTTTPPAEPVPDPVPATRPAATPVRPVTPPIRVTVDSTPRGATVTIDGETRGTTPYTARLERSTTQVEIKLALAGYVPVTRTIALTDNVVLSISLERPRAPERPAPVVDQAPSR